MPDLTIEYRYTCPSNISWAKTVKGSKGDEYLVSFHGDGLVQWHCTCPAFQYGKSKKCKHIKQVEKDRCGWAWESFCGDHMEPKPDPKKPGGFGLCPMCGEEVEVIRVGV